MIILKKRHNIIKCCGKLSCSDGPQKIRPTNKTLTKKITQFSTVRRFSVNATDVHSTIVFL